MHRYIRSGQCNRCGKCCPDCEHLKFIGDITECDIYKDRPQACRDYPDLPPIINKTCGYKFFDTQTRKTLGYKEV